MRECRHLDDAQRVIDPGQAGGRADGVAVARGHRQSGQREDPAPVVPGVEAGVLILADDQPPARAGLLGVQLAQGLDRVAGAGAVELAGVDGESRLALGDASQHRDAIRAGRGRPIALVRRPARRQPDEFVQRHLRERGLGERAVREMRWVEAAAEESGTALGIRQGVIQSRGRRKSV